MNHKLLIAFHHPCSDGIASASILRTLYGAENVELVPVDYTMPPPDMKGRRVYIVDFSWPPEVLLPAIKGAELVTMIDHHEGAIKKWENIKLPPNLTFVKEVGISGGELTWKWAHGNRLAPQLIRLLGDYDIFKFAIPGSREVTVGLYGRGIVHRLDFDEFDKMVDYFEHYDIRGHKALFAEGKAIMANDEIKVQTMIGRNMAMMSLAGYIVPAANVPHEFASRVSEVMAKGHAFSVTYEDWRAKGVRKYSLRAPKVGGINVARIAELFGGSGHASAAGFQIPLDQPQPLQELRPIINMNVKVSPVD